MRHGPSIGYAPWVITLVIAAFAGFSSYKWWAATDALNENKAALGENNDDLEETRDELHMLRLRAGKVEDRASAVKAELNRTKDEYLVVKEEMAKKAAAADELAAKLQDIISGDEGELIRKDGGQLSLKLMDKVLFPTGEAELTAKGKEVLRAVGEALNNFPDKQVWVQGHTDKVPIAKNNLKLFATNWELSAARALNVVHFLQDEVKVDPRRLAAVAFSQYRPVSRQYKAKNRRIEIVLFPKEVQVVPK